MNALFEVHTELSRLCFAVKLALEPLSVEVQARWRDGTYLSVDVECFDAHKMRVVDALKHGALHGPYDYRFTGISYPTMPVEHPFDRVTVTAYPDMHHQRKR